jgi:hypothetical protein
VKMRRKLMRWAGQCCHLRSSGRLFGTRAIYRVHEGHWVQMIRSVVELCWNGGSVFRDEVGGY